MPKKLTNKEIDNRLIGRNIKRLDNYINAQTKHNWECLIENCNYIWKTTADSILNTKTECPNCSNNIKLTNEIVDRRLIDRNIRRLDNIINSITKHNWECLIEDCNYIWKTAFGNILSGTGCPKCSQGKNERLIGSILEKVNINFEEQKNIKMLNENELRNLRFDYYLSDFNIAIEYNGRQHYESVCFGGIEIERAKVNFIAQQERYKYKQVFCDNNNIDLISIDGRKYKDKELEKYIIEELIPSLNI